MEVKLISDAELDTFDALAKRHGTLFDTIAWTALFGRRTRRFGIYEKGGALVGGFSAYFDRRWGVEVIRNPPFTPACGPFLTTQATHPVSMAEARRRALEAMALFLDETSCALVSLPLDPRIEDGLPFLWRHFKVIPNYTYVVDLSLERSVLEAAMSTTRRRDVVKARRDGLDSRLIQDLVIVRTMVHRTFERKGKRIDVEALDAILRLYANATNSFAIGTFRGDVALACCFIVHDSTTAYYLMGAYDDRQPHYGAEALALFEAISLAQRLGLRWFDFEGSIVPTIERYFRGFGGRLTPYLTVNKGWLLLEMALKLYKRELF